MAKEIEHNWQRDPNIAQVVKGDEGASGTGILLTEDPSSGQVLAEILLCLKRIELHLQTMTDEQITDSDIEV